LGAPYWQMLPCLSPRLASRPTGTTPDRHRPRRPAPGSAGLDACAQPLSRGRSRAAGLRYARVRSTTPALAPASPPLPPPPHLRASRLVGRLMAGRATAALSVSRHAAVPPAHGEAIVRGMPRNGPAVRGSSKGLLALLDHHIGVVGVVGQLQPQVLITAEGA